MVKGDGRAYFDVVDFSVVFGEVKRCHLGDSIGRYRFELRRFIEAQHFLRDLVAKHLTRRCLEHASVALEMKFDETFADSHQPVGVRVECRYRSHERVGDVGLSCEVVNMRRPNC